MTTLKFPPDSTASIRYDTGYVHKRVVTENRFTPIAEPETLSMSAEGMVIVNELGDTLSIFPSESFYVAPEPAPKRILTAFDTVTEHAPLPQLINSQSMADKYKSLIEVNRTQLKTEGDWNNMFDIASIELYIIAATFFIIRIYEHITYCSASVRRANHS